jgi:pimeloyl-ACP methyl ester carboxylesterase
MANPESTVLLVLLGILFALVVVLLVISPGRPSPIVDEQGHPVVGSISEKICVTINGVEQGMFIRGRDKTKPVLLFVHGGAGMPEYFLAQRYPAALETLEEQFTVCWWERRGAGLSYSTSLSPQTITIEQMISDLLAVTDYLRDRFHQQKIYLMAHSGGTFFALQAIAQSPQSYHAYIAVAQIAYQLKSENVAYQHMLKRFKENGDAGMVHRLESAPPTMSVPLPASYMAIRDKAMHSLGVGTTRSMRSVITGVLLPSWLSPDYTVAEKVNIWRGKAFLDGVLWNKILATDLATTVTTVDIPVYFLHGIHDYTVTLPETKAYFEALKAPVKGFYTFQRSAHSPMFEEPERMRQIIEQDVFGEANSLADQRYGAAFN